MNSKNAQTSNAAPNQQKAQEAQVIHEHRLTLPEVVGWLLEDGMIEKAPADKLVAERRLYRGDIHPLVMIADQKWRNLLTAGKPLALEDLTEWMAKRVGLDYVHIDPLKVDFSIVTDVMSSAYATRFKILPLKVTTKDVVIATVEPYVREFEQLVELGRTNRQFDANDQHIVASSTGSGSTLSSSAPRTSTSSRGAIWVSCAFASTACCIRSTRSRWRCSTAMTSRMKMLGRMDVIEKRRPQDGRIKTRTRTGRRSNCGCRRCRRPSAKSW
jgi:general secretion pathway protein E